MSFLELIGRALIPAIFVALGLAPAFAAIWLVRRRHAKRVTPLTGDLLRPPGHSLEEELGRLDDTVQELFVFAMTLPLIMGWVIFLTGADSTPIAVLLCIVVELFIAWRLWKLVPDRRHKQLGLEGERFVGAELNLLMLEGCRVFHDVPIKYGNVDHVVIHSTGVYAINTKMLGKLRGETGGEAKRVTVDYTCDKMVFPDRSVPIGSAKIEGEAKSLAVFLTEAVGQPIKTKPMLALPGWYIAKRVGRGRVPVFNPVNAAQFFMNGPTTLSAQLQKQIAYQIDQRCRDIEPTAKEERAWDE